MKNLAQTLEALKPQFIEGLNNQLFIYTTIGSGEDESPMWIQMEQVKDGILKFVNSQKTGIGFRIPVDAETKELINAYRDECYDYFKYVKYKHIHEVARTVWNELAIGHNGNRIQSFMDSYKPIYFKPTVQQLINDDVITLNDVLDYAQIHIDANEKLFANISSEFSDWECSEGTLHPASMSECDCAKYEPEWESNDPNAPDYEDTQDVEWPTHTRSSSPEYIIASTSYRTEETYVFEANKDGKIIDYGEYGGIAKRWEDLEWVSYYAAVDKIFGEGRYQFVRRVETGSSDVMHMLFKRLELSEADFWDGDGSDLFLQ
jgi:hypothetical protein